MIFEPYSNAGVQDHSDFESAVMPLMPYLVNKAVHLTGNAADADDLVQDTYMLGMRKFHLFQPGTNLKAWLSRLQFNLYISSYRRRRNRPDGVRLDDVGDVVTNKSVWGVREGLESLSPAELVQEPSFHEDISEELKHGLNELDQRYRDVLLLSTVGDKSYQDIAETLNVPVGTVMSRLSRAKSHMRQFFASAS